MRLLGLGIKLGFVGLLTAAFIPVIWGVLSLFEPQMILWQADRIAGGRPYCIVVTDPVHPFRYTTVKSQSELTFNALVTHLDWGGSSGPFAETYYALLLLQKPNDVWNWSKKHLNFRDDVNLDQASIYNRDYMKFCSPTVGFAQSIH